MMEVRQMILTGKLEENVEKAESKEEAKKLIKEAGMELTDNELDQVSGGTSGVYEDNGGTFIY